MNQKAALHKLIRHRILLGLEIAVWAVFSLYAFSFVTSEHPSLSLHPDWFHGDKTLFCPTDTLLSLQGYNSPQCGDIQTGYSDNGFPIAIPGQATSGRFGLAHAINYGTAAAASLLVAAALLHRRGYNLILSPAYKR